MVWMLFSALHHPHHDKGWISSRYGLTIMYGDAAVQAEVAKETQLKGPITFPQERLLSYFWNLLKSEGNDDVASSQNERAAQQQQSAEVFMLLRSLVSLRLLSQARITVLSVLPCMRITLLQYMSAALVVSTCSRQLSTLAQQSFAL